MLIEYRNEVKFLHRMIALAAIPFAAFLGIVLTHLFGVFSHETRELVTSIFLGDLTRFGDFLGFLAIILCVVILPIIMVIAALYTVFLSPSHVINIDAAHRTVTCDFDLPLRKSYRKSYDFDDLHIKLVYDDEGSLIKLSLPDRWVDLTLISERSYRVAKQKFARLVEMGLPSK